MAVLIEARQHARLTQRDLSERLGRSHTFMHKVEIGERTLSFLEALDVAQALGLDPFDLVDKVLGYDKPKTALEPLVVTSSRAAKKKPKK